MVMPSPGRVAQEWGKSSALGSVPVERRALAAYHLIRRDPSLDVNDRLVLLAAALWPDRSHA